jgi:hypothetical protein
VQAKTSRILSSSWGGLSSGRGSRASPSGCQRPELLLWAPGGWPGTEAANSPYPGLGDVFFFFFFFSCVLQLGPFIIGKKERERERERERMTRPAGWKIKRLKKKRARPVLLLWRLWLSRKF